MPSQEELLEQQKANCPFCKIIAGEIPSKKVYEDETVYAILDIHPANKGHILLIPKEHQYLIQLLPQETINKVYSAVQKLTQAMRKAMIVPRVSLFLANGPTAGQQSPHCLIHLIPREPGDNLEHLDIQAGDVKQENTEAIAKNMKIMLRNLPVQEQAAPQAQAQVEPAQQAPPQPAGQAQSVAPAQSAQAPQILPQQSVQQSPKVPEQPTNPNERLEALFALLKEQPELHELIKEHPDKVEEFVAKNPALQQAFEGIDMHALSQILAQKEEHPDNVPRAVDLNDQELEVFLNEKHQLKELLEKDIEGLKKIIPKNKRLQHFFQGTSPEAVRERTKGIDFDLLKENL